MISIAQIGAVMCVMLVVPTVCGSLNAGQSCTVSTTVIDTDSTTDLNAGRLVVSPDTTKWTNATLATGRFYGSNYRLVNLGYAANVYVEFRPTLPAYGSLRFFFLNYLIT